MPPWCPRPCETTESANEPAADPVLTAASEPLDDAVATEWDEFKELNLEHARKSLSHPILFDGRNLFDPMEMEKLGFIYKSIGR